MTGQGFSQGPGVGIGDPPSLSPTGQDEFAGLGRTRPSGEWQNPGHFGCGECRLVRIQCWQHAVDGGEPQWILRGVDRQGEAAPPRAGRVSAQLEAGGMAVVAVGDESLPDGQTTGEEREFPRVVAGPQGVGDLSNPGDGDRHTAGDMVHELRSRRLHGSVGRQQWFPLGAQP
jgi:hypothetical protein